MEYKPVHKKNSSWTPTPVQKKGKSPGKMGHSSIQPKSNPSSAPSQEIGEYKRASADRLTANVMRGIQAKEQEQAEGSTLQRKSESPWAPTFEPPPPLPQSPASQLKGAFAPVSQNPIQRQCADCAKEEEEQSGEARKDLEEIGIQTKLTVGAPGDAYEQEADRVASQVISMSAPADSSASVQRQLDTNHPHHPKQIWQRAQSIKPVVHRQIDPRVQMREMIQRAHQIEKNQASGDKKSRLNASKGGGSPLSEGVRGFMEPRFGADFSGVRVHTGGEAVQMNRELGAQAFTHGSDVYFGQGKEPGNNELTAHELTHVVQQTGAVQLKSPGRQLSSSLSGNFISESMIQCDFWESLGRGWNMYWRLNDEGASLARTLMEWRMTGFGMTYEPVVQWSTFMTDRPEIQRAMAKKFKQLAVGFAATGGSGTFNDSVTGVKLNELESMRLTLHGCHRIEMSGNYEVSDEGGNKIVRFTNVHFIWIDRADLHPGTGTELSSGEVVDDREFTGAGWDYDIRIHFFMPRTSTWRVSGRTARHERGWPPVTGAPAAGFRG